MSAVQINFAGEEELRELPGVGARVGTQVDDPVFYPLPVRTTDLHRAILEDRRLNQ